MQASKALRCLLRKSENFMNITFILFPILLFYLNLLMMLSFEDPFFGKYISALENIQKRFPKFLIFKKTGVYPQRGSDNHELCLNFKLLTLGELNQV